MKAPASVATRWTTPRVLRLLVGLVWLLSVLLFAVGLRALAADRESLLSLRRDTAPAIVTAQELGAQLADLDTQLATSMLGSAADRDVASELFALRRSAVARRLVDAAGDVNLGDVDRVPVVVMSEEIGRYLELAARAQWLYAGGDADGALGILRVATDLMHERILPQAIAFDRAKRDQLDARYDRAQSASRAFEGEAVACGGALVAALLFAQGFVRRRMRRRLVPAMALATVLAIGFTWYLVGRFHLAREDLRVARDDAFNSIHALWRARATAYDAAGDQARWLLDRPRAGAYEAAFAMKSAELLAEPHATTSAAQGRGMLADELRNVTFRGESEAAGAAVAAFVAFVTADERVRRLEATGKHAEAVLACLGQRSGDARASLDRLDAALTRTTAINQDAFEAVLALADRGLRRAEWLDPALALAIALLAWLGLRPRIREYAG